MTFTPEMREQLRKMIEDRAIQIGDFTLSAQAEKEKRRCWPWAHRWEPTGNRRDVVMIVDVVPNPGTGWRSEVEVPDGEEAEQRCSRCGARRWRRAE